MAATGTGFSAEKSRTPSSAMHQASFSTSLVNGVQMRSLADGGGERICTPFIRLVEKLTWCIADEGVLLFSAENPVPVTATRVSFAGKDGDDVGAYFRRMTVSAANATHLSGAPHRFEADLAIKVAPCIASFTAVDVSVAGIDVYRLAILFFDTLFSSVSPRAPTPASAPTPTVKNSSLPVGDRDCHSLVEFLEKI